MAKFTLDQGDSLPQVENNSESRTERFLKFESDGQKARVRFMVRSINEIELHSTHRVHVKTNLGREWDATVECLRTDGSQPVTACPFCEKGLAIKNEIYMQVFDEATKTVKVFTRPKGFVDTLRSVFNTIERFGNGAPVASALVEITRHGAKGAKDTTYSAEVVEFTPNVTLESLNRDYGATPLELHESGCIRDVKWSEANEWARTGTLPAPAKQKVDTYGRPLVERKEEVQVSVNAGQPQPVPVANPQPAPVGNPQAPAHPTDNRPVANQYGEIVAPAPKEEAHEEPALGRRRRSRF